ncbi:GH-E family nuclease [Acetobacteraceae bacterium ESL0697]|nr:GH-E family nuclease [Acetobacteraceae bacterium ESL0697]
MIVGAAKQAAINGIAGATMGAVAGEGVGAIPGAMTGAAEGAIQGGINALFNEIISSKENAPKNQGNSNADANANTGGSSGGGSAPPPHNDDEGDNNKNNLDTDKEHNIRRGKFRKGTIQQTWEEAAEGDQPGTKQCPTCGKDVQKVDQNGHRGYDIDHQPPWSERQKGYRDKPDIPNRKDVLDNYNSDVRLECKSCNRGRGARPIK